ncbi:amidohydrolase family protein [Chryseolinea sp. T2]|uniref:amidohydrolase family protein n=1 Tax=Chryseolinea sp. T2 TaxID=3129255 RepID=UPI00307881E1
MKNPCRSSGSALFLTLISILAITFSLCAQDVRNLPPVSRSYAITKVTVFQGPGRKLDNATVLVRDGVIAAVGQNLAVPADAVIVKGDSLYVYAGFIDGLSRVAVNKPKEETREKQKDPGNPAPEAAGITPYVDVRALLNPVEKSIEEWRSLGFTVGQVVPYGGMLPGRGALIYYNGEATDKMVLNPTAGLYSELTPAERMYPATILGVLAKWKELYRQATYAKSYGGVYAANKSGLEVPESDRILEAFYPVIDKQIPVIFKAEKSLDAQRVLALKSQLGFNLTIAELKEGWDLIPSLKSNAKIFLSLELPEEKKDDKGKVDAEKKKDEQAMFPDSVEFKALEKRRDDFIALYAGQAAAYQKAGVSFGFSTLSAKPKDVKGNLKRMIKAGLSEDAALAALTTNAAQALGVGDRLGTIDNGKIANLVISRRPYFDDKSKVVYVFIAGKLYKVNATPEKAEADKKKEKP